MRKRDWLAKVLAVVGTLGVLLPIVATVATARFDRFGGGLQVDWLMPAELFPIALVGSLLLLWASVRGGTGTAWVAWGLGTVVGMLAAVLVIPQVTGLASGATQPETAPLAMTAVELSLGVYAAALLEMGVVGILVARDLFRQSGPTRPLPALSTRPHNAQRAERMTR